MISVAGFREHFPSQGEKIIVYDDEGREYPTKMHKEVARIDGLTQWYRNHPTAKIGDTIVITVNPDKSVILSLKKEVDIYKVEEIEEEVSTIEMVPCMEGLLEDFLEKNLEYIENGLNLYHDEDGVPGRQYSTDVGPIDLLCRDMEGNFVILEIKKERGSDRTIGQITRYMGWVKEKLANNKDVRGIIIAHEKDRKLEYSLSVLNNIEVKYYRILLEFI